MVVWGERSACPERRQPQQIVAFLLIFPSSLPCPLPCSPPIPSPYFTFSNVSITAGHKPPCCVCVCVSARGRERETKEDHIKDFPCLLRSNVLPLSVSFSPLMWPVLISSADIAAVPSPLVEKDSFPTEKDALEHSTHTQHTHTHTLKHLWTVRGSGANRKWLLLRRGMKRSGCSEEHKAKGNFESGEVPTITFLPFSVLHTRTHAHTQQRACAHTHTHTTIGTQTRNCLWQEQAAPWPLASSWLRDSDIANNRFSFGHMNIFSFPAYIFKTFFRTLENWFLRWFQKPKDCEFTQLIRGLCVPIIQGKRPTCKLWVVSRVSAVCMLIVFINTQVASQNPASSYYWWWVKCVIMGVCG